jgi:hypothetical protein
MGQWEYLAVHPDAAETFNRMATSNTAGRATSILEAYDFSAATTRLPGKKDVAPSQSAE